MHDVDARAPMVGQTEIEGGVDLLAVAGQVAGGGIVDRDVIGDYRKPGVKISEAELVAADLRRVLVQAEPIRQVEFVARADGDGTDDVGQLLVQA